MAAILLRDNGSLGSNPPPPDALSMSVGGSDWLWAVTAIFALSFLCIYALSFRPRNGEKIFHYIFTVTLLAGTVAYFSMASNLGWAAVNAANQRDRDDDRQIFYAKFVYWVVSFPAAILSLGLVSGVSWATMTFNVFLSWAWVLSYLLCSVTSSNYKWGFFVFGTVAWLVLAHSTLVTGTASAKRVEVSRDYLILAGWLNLLWLLYPLGFGLTDGGNRIGVTASVIWFGVLDVLMIPVIAFALLALSSKWDFGRLNLHFTQYGRVASDNGTFPEKQAATASGAAAPAPVTETV